MSETTQLILKNVKKNLHLIICVLLTCVMGGLIYVRGGLLPDLQTRFDESSEKLNVMLRNEAQGTELARELEEIKRLTSDMETRLMQVDAKAQNYQFFYDIESKSKATILSLNQLITNPGDGVLRPKLTEFTGVSFDLTLSGRILYVMNFLKRLEGGKYFVRFNSVTLRGNSAIAEDGVEAVLKLEVLAKKP